MEYPTVEKKELETLYEVQNLVRGEFKESYGKEKLVRKDMTNSIELTSSPNSTRMDLAMALKGAKKAEKEMQEYSTDELIDIIKNISRDYLQEKETRKLIVQLTGSVLKYVNESIEGVRYWMNNIDNYLEVVFGNANYLDEGVPVYYNSKEIGRHVYKPKGMIGAILPGNEVGIPSLVLTQTILSRNPVVLKPDSRESVSSYEYCRLLKENGLPNAVQMVIWSASSRPELGKELIKHTKQRIIFGSDETIENLACHRDENGNIIADYRNEYLYQYGTGRSKSIVAEDADLKLAAKKCVEGAVKDRGTKCISNKLAIVDKKIYEEFLSLIEKEAAKVVVGDSLNPKTDIGYLGKNTVTVSEKLIKEACDIHGHHIRQGEFYEKHTDLIIVENVNHKSDLAREEIPIPILSIMKVEDFKDAVEKANKSVEHTPDKKSLIVAVFTNNLDNMRYCRNIKAWKVVHNRATTDINIFLPHQGRYMIEDMMKRCTIEYDPIGLYTAAIS